MERTKGKVKVSAYEGGWTGVRAEKGELLFKLALNNEDNAGHLVHCWNAFEEDGIVSKLMGLLEGASKAMQLYHEALKEIAGTVPNMPNTDRFIEEVSKVLAEAKGKL